MVLVLFCIYIYHNSQTHWAIVFIFGTMNACKIGVCSVSNNIMVILVIFVTLFIIDECWDHSPLMQGKFGPVPKLNWLAWLCSRSFRECLEIMLWGTANISELHIEICWTPTPVKRPPPSWSMSLLFSLFKTGLPDPLCYHWRDWAWRARFILQNVITDWSIKKDFTNSNTLIAEKIGDFRQIYNFITIVL